MTKSEIRIFAHKQTLGTGKATAKYAGDTVNYIKVHFNLDENWDGYDSIRAVWANKATISTLLDSNNDCVIPFEVLANKGDVMVNLIASKVENGEVTDRFTSYPFVACSVTADVVLNGSETAPITPSQFEQFVEVVKEDADRAEASADDAEQSASASANSALQASGYAQEAEISAERAETAKEDAETAKDEAEDARDEIRSMTATATTLAEGSQATASYDNGVLLLGIPKGDKGNKGDIGASAGFGTVTASVDDTIGTPSVEVTASGSDTAKNFAFAFHNLKGQKGDKGDTGEVTMEMLEDLLPTDTASGAIASFPDGTDILPAISVLDSIEPIQDLHGYDKPWSGGNGKNLINPLYIENLKYIQPTGNIETTTGWSITGFIPVEAGATYILNIQNSGTAAYHAFYDSNQNFVSSVISTTSPITIPNGISYIRLSMKTASNDPTTTAQFERGTTSSSWTPYTNICPISGHTEVVTSVSPTASASDATTYTTALGRTVYGGTLDVVSGVLTVDMMYGQMTYAYLSGLSSSYLGLGSEQSTLGGATVFVRNWNYSIAEPRKAGGIEAYCNAFPVSMHNTDMFGSQNRTYFGIGSMTTVEEFLQAVQTLEQNGSGLFIAFKLATPQTIQLSPQEVELLKGTNNLWCDSGEIEVTYKADIQKYIEKKMG